LLQLVSPALPIGAFHFSQGLEYAVEAGWVGNEETAGEWIGGLAAHSVGTLDLPLLIRMHEAWLRADEDAVRQLSRRLLAARESAEQRAEDRHLGAALARILGELGIAAAAAWQHSADASYAALFALAASAWHIGPGETSHGYLWAWCENQVLAAIKLVPLGQTAGQRLLDRLIGEIPSIVARSRQIGDDAIGVASPMQGIACALHETQYSRLFRS
jgi:urease accessory protein